MKNRRYRRLALGVALALCGPQVLAGEIVLFGSENFQGPSMAFPGTVPNLDGTGFNDRAASISVRDGTWEVCFDANFQGGCMQLSPGDYPRLDPPFDRSISSLRELGGPAPRGNYPAPAPQPSAEAPGITLFEGPNFQGERATFGGEVPNLDGTGFNDRAASISVLGSDTWVVCFDANFQGGCMELPPGNYPRLDPPFDRTISSVRPIGGGGGYGGPSAAPDGGAPQAYDGEVSGAGIGLDLPSYPELVPVPGYPVYYAPQVNSNYFFYDGMYWVYQRDNWYASSWYNGPWGLVAPAAVPLFVLRVPVSYYRRPPALFPRLECKCAAALGRSLGQRLGAESPGVGQLESQCRTRRGAPAGVPAAIWGKPLPRRVAAARAAKPELPLSAAGCRGSPALSGAAGRGAGFARSAATRRRPARSAARRANAVPTGRYAAAQRRPQVRRTKSGPKPHGE